MKLEAEDAPNGLLKSSSKHDPHEFSTHFSPATGWTYSDTVGGRFCSAAAACQGQRPDLRHPTPIEIHDIYHDIMSFMMKVDIKAQFPLIIKP